MKLNKFLLLFSIPIAFASMAEAHLYLNDAGNITVGTLDPNRVSPDSFTLQSNTFNAPNKLLLLDSNGRIPGSITTTPSTTTVAYNLIITTSGAGNNVITASASFINIMGCESVNFSSSAVLTKNGPGGLNVGVAIASQSYTLLAIADNVCSQFGVMFTSQPFTQVIMPSGFTKWRPLASFYNAAGSSFIIQTKRGRRVTRQANQFICDIADIGTTPSMFDMTQWISSNAVSATFHVYALGKNSGGTAAFVFRANGYVGGGASPDQTYTYAFPDTIASAEYGADITIPIIDNRTLQFYEVTNMGEFVLFMTSYEEEY